VSLLASFMANPSEIHWKGMKRLMRYVKGTIDLGICLGGTSLDLRGFGDSSFADRDERASTGGYVFMLGKGPISWSSKAQSIVTMSTTEAEYVQVAETAKEALWLKQLLPVFDMPVDTVQLYCDNESAIKLLKLEATKTRTKHIDIRYHFVRQRIKTGDILVSWIASADNTADIFTKPLAHELHVKMLGMLNLVRTGQFEGEC
jgi:hypothetical protein